MTETLSTILSRLENLPSLSGRPMLAGRIEKEDKIRFPKLGSLKIDGYRAIYSSGEFFARSGKLHQAPAIRALAKDLQKRGLPDGLDGELTIPGKSFNEAGGLLRREDYSGEIFFQIFDLMQDGLKAQERFQFLAALSSKFPTNVSLLDQVWLKNLEDMRSFENDALASGAEGIVLRDPGALYKHGRGTERDQVMLKIKRFKSAEALILSAEPRMKNLNEQERTPLGYAERSTAKENLVETDILGKLNVIGLNGQFKNKEFSIGNFDGLIDEEKRFYLKNSKEELLGKIITFKYFPEGVLDRPRHPVFIGFRPDFDIDKEGEETDE